MRKVFLLVAILFLNKIGFAQTIISGFIKDNRNHPINGASITIKDSYDGATTDSSGKFHFATTEKNEHTIIITAVGYRSFEQKLSLTGTSQMINVVLKEEINELKAVTITAGAFEASDRKRTTVLNSIDIVTTASANADVTGAIKTLPGAQQIGEAEGLFVRGGTAAETKIFIDGTLVNNFFYTSEPNIATRGRFSPFIFKGTVFSAGGYSALYGQALSSALILESIDLPDKSFANLGLSFIGGSAGFQKLSKKKNASWGINYGYTNVYLAFKVLKTKPDYFQIPEYANLVLKKFVTKLKTQFNTNYVFATGRPYYNIQYDYNNNKFSMADQGKTIPYNSLSFSINYLPDIFKKDAKKFTVFVFSITNVLGSRQVFGYNYSYNGHRKEAIVPPTKTFIYLGAFFSFGVDRTQNAINNNL